MKNITYDEVHRLFDYNPVTGIFTNKIFRGTQALKGEVAGCLNGDGYWQIQVKEEKYLAHRLAWLYVHGYFPENDLDHRDKIKHHNWIKNLREATKSCNAKNSKVYINNASGITGVYWNKHAKKWMVRIQDKNHKRIYLGIFESLLEAAKARYAAEIEHNYPDCQTESSALKYINKCQRNT